MKRVAKQNTENAQGCSAPGMPARLIPKSPVKNPKGRNRIATAEKI